MEINEVDNYCSDDKNSNIQQSLNDKFNQPQQLRDILEEDNEIQQDLLKPAQDNIYITSPATLDIPGIDLLKDGRQQVYSNTSAKKRFYSPISPC